MSPTTICTTTTLNGTALYYEVRGAGAPIVFIPGAFGDAAVFERVADQLAEHYTVITYDRRGNSRSPRPAIWAATSLDEQAEDVAALLDHLGFESAIVYAQSLGGAIGLKLALHRPDLVSYAILHEPWLAFLDPDPAASSAVMLEAVTQALAVQDFRGAAAALLQLVAGEHAVELVPKAQRDRMLDNAETLFTIEFPGVLATTLDDVTPRVPVTLSIGAESPDFLTAGAATLAALTGLPTVITPGAHVPQLTHADELCHQVHRLIDEAAAPQGGRR